MATFDQLLAIWQNPNGTNPTKSRSAFVAVVDDGGDPDKILATAKKHIDAKVTAGDQQYIPQLDKWIATGQWKFDPIDRSKSAGKKAGGGVGKKAATGGDQKAGQSSQPGPAAASGKKPATDSAIVNLTLAQQEEANRRRDEGEEEIYEIAVSFGVPEHLVIERQMEFEKLKSKYHGKWMALATLADTTPLNSAAEIANLSSAIAHFKANVIKPLFDYQDGLPEYEAELDPVYQYYLRLEEAANECEKMRDVAVERLKQREVAAVVAVEKRDRLRALPLAVGDRVRGSKGNFATVVSEVVEGQPGCYEVRRDSDGAVVTTTPTAHLEKRLPGDPDFVPAPGAEQERRGLFKKLFAELDPKIIEFERYKPDFDWADCSENDLNEPGGPCDVLNLFQEDVLQVACDFEDSLPPYFDPERDPVHGFVGQLDELCKRLADKIVAAQVRIDEAA